MAAPAELPAIPPSHANGMLDKRFGKEVLTYFSASPLNRVSFLRTDSAFLHAALHHPTATFVLLHDLAPLAHGPSALAYAHHADVAPLLAPEPYARSEDEALADASVSRHPTAPPPVAPILVFLGLDEDPPGTTAPPASPFRCKEHSGTPFFALDLTPRPALSSEHRSAAESLLATLPSALGYDGHPAAFLPGRTHTSFTPREAALYAQARSHVDWNARNPHCGGCGARTLSLHAGYKRTCTNDAPAASASACPARTAHVSNLSFPRTDPTVIIAVLAPGLTHVLLGRQARWPPRWYSCIAGFLELGESAEDAARREVWEESGVRVGRVQLVSSQTWPYPAGLMVGCVGVAAPGEGLRRGATGAWERERAQGNDGELEDARWWPVETVRGALEAATESLDKATRERGKGEAWVDQEWKGGKDGELRLPPKTAIANQLIEAAVEWASGSDAKL